MQSRRLLTAVFVLCCIVLDANASVTGDCEDSTDWISLQSSQPDNSLGMINLDAETINIGQPFSFKFKLGSAEDEKPGIIKKPDRVTATATMPAHKHGMNYLPTVVHQKGCDYYDIQDFVFHMPGSWKISISIYRGDAATHYTRSLTIQ